MPASDQAAFELLKFILSVILGGLFGAALKFGADEFSYRRGKVHTGQEKLIIYAKPLWRACDDLATRLADISETLKGLQSKVLSDEQRAELEAELELLCLSPKQNASALTWFNQEGQRVVSTAYLIGALAAWIALFERDVVFLPFGKVSTTKHFFEKLETLKAELADDGSILWYDYFAGIGDKMILEERHQPMSIAEFSFRLYQDPEFCDYFDQLFQFLGEIKRKQNDDKEIRRPEQIVVALQDITQFLMKNGAIPELGRKVEKKPQLPDDGFKKVS